MLLMIEEMPDADPSDFELMQRIARREEEAFRLLMERYQREVYGTIVRMLGDPVEAEDVAQQVFIRVYHAAPRYQPTAQFRTWLFTILRNLVFNESHRRSKFKVSPLISAEEEEGSNQRDWEDSRQKSPSDDSLEREQMGAIDAAIQELPPPQRMAVLLKAHQDLSYEEIAVVLNTSVSATKSLLFRARETLRQKLSNYLQE